MECIVNECASLQFDAGMTPFLNDQMRVCSPAVRSKHRQFRFQFVREDQYYWVVRTITNYLISTATDSDVVFGVAVVFETGIELHVFTASFELAKQVNRIDAIVCYSIFACTSSGGDWLLKVTKECLDEQSKSA